MNNPPLSGDNLEEGPQSPKAQLTQSKSSHELTHLSRKRKDVDVIIPYNDGILEKEYVDPQGEEEIHAIIAILHRLGSKRTEKEMRFLKKAFLSVKLVQDMENELDRGTFIELFREFKYEFCPRGKALFNYGDMGRNWYFILRGNVYVVVPRRRVRLKKMSTHLSDFNDEEAEVVDEQIINIPPPPDPSLQQIKPPNLSLEEEILWDNPGFFIVNELGYGGSFGEIALRSKIPRTATIIAKEDTHLAVLTFDAYMNIVAQFHEVVYKNKVSFLQTVSIFKTWSTAGLEILLNHVNVLEFHRNQIIFKEGDSPDFIYFIVNGEIEVSKIVVDAEKRNEEAIGPGEKSNLNSLNAVWKKQLFKACSKRVKVALLGPGCYFGEEELVSKETRKSLAMCVSSSTEIYSVAREKFLDHCKGELMFPNFREQNAILQDWRQNHVDSATTTQFHLDQVRRTLVSENIQRTMEGSMTAREPSPTRPVPLTTPTQPIYETQNNNRSPRNYPPPLKRGNTSLGARKIAPPNKMADGDKTPMSIPPSRHLRSGSESSLIPKGSSPLSRQVSKLRLNQLTPRDADVIRSPRSRSPRSPLADQPDVLSSRDQFITPRDKKRDLLLYSSKPRVVPSVPSYLKEKINSESLRLLMTNQHALEEKLKDLHNGGSINKSKYRQKLLKDEVEELPKGHFGRTYFHSRSGSQQPTQANLRDELKGLQLEKEFLVKSLKLDKLFLQGNIQFGAFGIVKGSGDLSARGRHTPSTMLATSGEFNPTKTLRYQELKCKYLLKEQFRLKDNDPIITRYKSLREKNAKYQLAHERVNSLFSSSKIKK